MTEIYLRKDVPSRKPLVLGVAAALLLLVLAGLAWSWLRRERPETDLAEQTGPAGSSSAAPLLSPGTALATSTSLRDGALVDPGAGLLAKARGLQEEGLLLEAREAYLGALEASTSEANRQTAREALGNLHTLLALTPREMPEKVEYTVQRGDTLGGLARKFGTTVELIRKSNNISGSMIRVGDRYRILQGKFSMRVSKTDNILDLYLNDRFFKRYRVGTGRFARTPVGDFKVTDRIAQPTWWRPDGKAIPYGSTNNLLGTHWMSINVPGYGIHGTWEPDSIGRQASEGCIRMLNEEVEELFALAPIGTPVTITE